MSYNLRRSPTQSKQSFASVCLLASLRYPYEPVELLFSLSRLHGFCTFRGFSPIGAPIQLHYALRRAKVMGMSTLENYETASDVAKRLSIDASQVRRYLEEGRFPGAFKLHPRLWLVPKGAVPEPKDGGRPPTWKE